VDHTVEILHIGFITHDVKQFITTRPDGLQFEPGQGVEIAIDLDGWRDLGRPFTPTSLPGDPVLEFVIKEYPDDDGVTEKLHSLKAGQTLFMSDAFGTIQYRGPGVFIAGGAGVTPFLAILRSADAGELERCSLHFSNSTPADVICEKELLHLLGDRCHLTFTVESAPGHENRRIDRSYLEEKIRDLSGPFYVCGPPDFVEEITAELEAMGVGPDRIVVEE